MFELLSCRNPLKMPSSDPTKVSTNYITIFYFISQCAEKLILIITFRHDFKYNNLESELISFHHQNSFTTEMAEVINYSHQHEKKATGSLTCHFQYQCCVLY